MSQDPSESDDALWLRETHRNGHARNEDYETDYDDGDYEVVDYRPSDGSRNSSPIPDQPPRLPSPSESSPPSQSQQSDGTSAPRSQNWQPETTETMSASPMSRQGLAQRLARIARQLATTPEDELQFDDLAMVEQVNQLEMNLLGISSTGINHDGTTVAPQSPVANITTALPIRTRPSPKSQRREVSQEAVTDSAAQLAGDLETLHENLRARHEEATHIQALLLSRLELAAQRILFLQRHATELETQLRESDDELGHLRVLLKALEIQVPEHPDEDMRRCLVRVREEFWAVRKRRDALNRSNGVERKVG